MKVSSLTKLEGLLLVDFLRSTYKKPPLSLFSRLLGESTEYEYEITKVEDFPFFDEVKQSKLKWVTINGHQLQFPSYPGSTSSGLFAFFDEECIYLCSEFPDNLSVLLRREKDISHIAAYNLAKLFCLSVISNKKTGYNILNNFNDIDERSNSQEGYLIDPDKADLIKNVITQPTVDFGESETVLKFYTLSGWLHSSNTISEVIVNFKKDYSFSYDIKLICKGIFSRVPMIRY